MPKDDRNTRTSTKLAEELEQADIETIMDGDLLTRILNHLRADHESESVSRSNRVQTTIDALRSIIDFAYEHGYHELGCDPLDELVSLLKPPSDVQVRP